MKSILLNTYAFNLQYANELVKDVAENMMHQSPSKGHENHPSFTLGHLVSAAALTSKYLGGPYELKPAWEDLFKRKGPGDPQQPDPNADAYPTKNQLLDELKNQHNIVASIIEDLDEARFQEPVKWRFQEHMPTLGDLLFFMCVSHESMHLGQLAGWRRAMGLPSALAKL